MKTIQDAILEVRTNYIKTKKEVETTEKAYKASGPISFWLEQDYKDDYEELQRLSNKEFGKEAQKMLKLLIDLCKEAG